jgi:hypothetical protein
MRSASIPVYLLVLLHQHVQARGRRVDSGAAIRSGLRGGGVGARVADRTHLGFDAAVLQLRARFFIRLRRATRCLPIGQVALVHLYRGLHLPVAVGEVEHVGTGAWRGIGGEQRRGEHAKQKTTGGASC